MMLPTDDGVLMSFDAMNYEQRQRALTLLCGTARDPSAGPPSTDPKAR